jgi:hypothetical protein
MNRNFVGNIGSFGKTVSEEKNFYNQPIRNKNRLWQPCLLMDLEEMSNLHRGPPIDDTYQVSEASLVSDWSISKNLLL